MKAYRLKTAKHLFTTELFNGIVRYIVDPEEYEIRLVKRSPSNPSSMVQDTVKFIVEAVNRRQAYGETRYNYRWDHLDPNLQYQVANELLGKHKLNSIYHDTHLEVLWDGD
jgi:hypothetical protein